MRSGQPLTGTNGRRCKEDERLINATLRPGKRGYVIDTRTISVAQQAKARGGGFETEANYPQWRRIHKAIERSALARDEWQISFLVLYTKCPICYHEVGCQNQPYCDKENSP